MTEARAPGLRVIARGVSSERGRGSSAPIRILQTDNIVLLEVRAALNLDQFKRELTGIVKSMSCARRNESRLILLQEEDFLTERDFGGPLDNHPVLRAMI